MQQNIVERVKNNPKYKELLAKRTPFAWVLAVVMLAVYYGFILVIAFSPKLLAIKVTDVITLGIPVGVGIILFAFVITGIYVFRANGEFDTLTRQIKEDLK